MKAGSAMRKLVIDVSTHDGDVDIDAWKESYGAWACIVRCGGSEDQKVGRYADPRFDQNYAKAVAAGLHVGAYYLSKAVDADEARADAEHCLGVLGDRPLDMPVYMDVELSCQLEADPRDLTDAVHAFCEIIERGGYIPGIYTYNAIWLGNLVRDELYRYADWIAQWGENWPTSAGDVGMWQRGCMRLDGDLLDYDPHDSTYQDVSWCVVDYPSRQRGRGMKRKISIADEQAQIHYFMCVDPRFGYNQQPERWGRDGDAPIEFTTSSGRKYVLDPGSYDCSSSEIYACRKALEGTPYAHSLDGASFTGDMEDAFLTSGLYTSSRAPAKRGDIYLTAGDHTAMCQDGGSDDVFGYDCLTEFNRNELGQASWGEPGDQDGYESVFRDYYDRPWATVLHYNGTADYYVNDETEKEVVELPIANQPSKAKNDFGVWYRVHIETGGWLDPVHDGMTAGTEGISKRIEALKITPPEGVVIDVYTHEQGLGHRYFEHVQKGKRDPVMGTVGQSRRIEAFRLCVSKLERFRGKKLCYQGHVQGLGWTKVCKAGYLPDGSLGEWCGTTGQGKRLEAIRIWLE